MIALHALPAIALLAVPAADFDEAGLVESLTHPDLLEREGSFVAVVESARTDRELFGWLCARAADPAPTELSWTCRLAVREIELTGGASHQGRTQHGAPLHAQGPVARTIDSPEDFLRAIQELEQGLLAAWGAVPTATLDPTLSEAPGIWFISPQASLDPRRLRNQPSSGVRVQLVEELGGELVERVYEAQNLPQLLQEHPELEERLSAFRASLRFPWEGLQNLQSDASAQPFPPPDPTKLGVYVERVAEDTTSEDAPSEDTASEETASVGLVVHGVVPGSLGHLLGLVRGDLLIELNGRPMRLPEDISTALEARTEGEGIEARWRTRSGLEKSATWLR